MLRNLCPQYVVFQFHKGTIKPMSTYSSYVSFSYFNSIKVQLSRVFTERNIFGI